MVEVPGSDPSGQLDVMRRCPPEVVFFCFMVLFLFSLQQDVLQLINSLWLFTLASILVYYAVQSTDICVELAYRGFPRVQQVLN